MAKEGKSSAMPKLRFPEFREAVGWKTTLLGEAFHRITNGKANAQDHEEGGAYPLFDRSEVVKSSHSFVFHTEAIVLPGEGVAFRPRHFEGKFNLHQRAYALMDCQGHGKFFYYALDHAKGRLARKAVKSTVLSLRLPIVEKFEVFAPERAEQQKIADCLTSLDEVIAAQGRKVEALKTYKRGLTQQLFPGEGDLPPIFSARSGWPTVELPEVAYFQEGPGILATDFRNEGIPLVRLAGLGGLTVTLDGCNFLDPKRVAQKWDHFRLAPDDLLISTSASFGRPAIVTDIAAGAVFYTGLIRFRPRDTQLERGYLEAFLGSPFFMRQAESSATGTGIKHFGPTHLQQMRIPVPPTPEQKRIANCALSADRLLAAEAEKLDALRTHKKGLMQQLFPSPEEA